MTTVTFEQNRPFWEEFITIYRDNPCLWDSRTPDWRNRRKKAEAYDILVEKCKEVFYDADRDFVIKKICSLRASFRRQYRKVKDAIKNGNEPLLTLWYYDLLAFVLEIEGEEYLTASFISAEETENFKHENNETLDSSATISSGFSESALTSQPVKKKKKRQSHPPACPKKREKIEYVELPDQTDDHESAALADRCQEDSFGENVSQQLKELSRRQKIIAQKLISDVLYHAQLENLTEQSFVSPEPAN